MPFANSNRAGLQYILETTAGTTPGAGNPRRLRMTGESLKYDIKTTSSNELRDDRMTSDLTQTDFDAMGGVNLELSYREYDALLEALTQGTASVYGTNGEGTSFTADITTTTITAGAAPTGNSAFTTLKKGQWFQLALTDTNNANHKRLFRVSQAVSPTATVITLDASTPGTAGTGLAGAKVRATQFANPTTSAGLIQRAFSIQRHQTDVGLFFIYRGMVPGKLDLKFDVGSIVTGSLDFTGMSSDARNTTTWMPGAPQASYAYDVMNGVRGISAVYEGGTNVMATAPVKSVSLSIDNSLRAQKALGVLGSIGIAADDIKVTGSVEMYLSDLSMYNKFVNNTSSSLSFPVMDTLGNGYVFTVPRLKYSSGTTNAGGKNQDQLIKLDFTGILDPVTGTQMQIDRFGEAAA